MIKLEWNRDLSIGIKRIDEQHKHLLHIANGLINAIALGRDRKTLQNVFRKLREYTVFHFNSEEAYMEEVRYEKRAQHASEHRELKEQVKQYQRHLYLDEELTPQAVRAFIKKWLLNHILQSDMELGEFVTKRS